MLHFPIENKILKPDNKWIWSMTYVKGKKKKRIVIYFCWLINSGTNTYNSLDSLKRNINSIWWKISTADVRLRLCYILISYVVHAMNFFIEKEPKSRNKFNIACCSHFWFHRFEFFFVHSKLHQKHQTCDICTECL